VTSAKGKDITDPEKRIPGLTVKDQTVMCAEFLIDMIGEHVSWDSTNHGCRKEGSLTSILIQRPWEHNQDVGLIAARVRDSDGDIYEVGLWLLDFD